jgi:hypothetical protein
MVSLRQHSSEYLFLLAIVFLLGCTHDEKRSVKLRDDFLTYNYRYTKYEIDVLVRVSRNCIAVAPESYRTIALVVDQVEYLADRAVNSKNNFSEVNSKLDELIGQYYAIDKEVLYKREQWFVLDEKDTEILVALEPPLQKLYVLDKMRIFADLLSQESCGSGVNLREYSIPRLVDQFRKGHDY